MFKNVLLKKNIKGQAMVETALVLPVLVLLMGAIVTIGQFMDAKSVCSAAAYAAARKAVVMTDEHSAMAVAKRTAEKYVQENGIKLRNIRCTHSVSPTNAWVKGNDLTYTVTADVDLLFGLLLGNKQVESNITIMIERE